MDWIGHHCDIAHWGCDFDNSGPYELGRARENSSQRRGLEYQPPSYRIKLKYPRNITMTIAGRLLPEIRSGVKWTGTKGWVYVDRGAFEGSNEEWRDYRDLPEELCKVKLYVSNDHHLNFLPGASSRANPPSPRRRPPIIPSFWPPGPHFDAGWTQD